MGLSRLVLLLIIKKKKNGEVGTALKYCKATRYDCRLWQAAISQQILNCTKAISDVSYFMIMF